MFHLQDESNLFLQEQHQTMSLDHGKLIPLHTCAEVFQLGKVTLKDYLGSNWTFDGIIDDPVSSFISWILPRHGKDTQYVVSTVRKYLVPTLFSRLSRVYFHLVQFVMKGGTHNE